LILAKFVNDLLLQVEQFKCTAPTNLQCKSVVKNGTARPTISVHFSYVYVHQISN